MNPITSLELNYIVFRYLQESGFLHSAFAFGHEAGIQKSPIDGNLVPPGALVTFVQKGLHFLEMEANLSNPDSDLDEDFSFLQPLDLITKNVSELQQIINEKRKEKLQARKQELDREHEGARKRVLIRDKQDREKEREKERKRTEHNKPREKRREDHIERKMTTSQQETTNLGHEENRVSGGPEPMDISTYPTTPDCEIPGSDVMILKGHENEVCCCAWSPAGSVLASGSGDSTARIWTIGDRSIRSSFGNSPSSVVLEHVKGKNNEKSKDVTTLEWNRDGTLLATGSYDGQARIWSTNGELVGTLSKHRGPIFALKWSKKGEYIVSGSCDKTAIVWDVKTKALKQLFEFHSGPVLDADWRTNVSFATSSSDTLIHVCKVGETQPLKTFFGHQGEVNCVKWDPTGTLLASCSDDNTAKIWSLKHDNYVHDLREHTKEIYTIRWSPTGPGTNNPNLPLVLASASFDSTVKLWDVEQGKLLCNLNGHRDSVYSVAFSPNGEYLATGSRDKSLHIWSLKEGKIIKTYTGNGGIFEVCWHRKGRKIAASYGNNVVCVMDFRM